MPTLPPSAEPDHNAFELTDLWPHRSAAAPSEEPSIHDGLSNPLSWPEPNSPVGPDVARPQTLTAPENSTQASEPFVLDQLHRAYWQYLHQAHAQADAQDSRHLPPRSASDKAALEDLTRNASRYESLYSILGDRVAIDDVMASLDSLGANDLLEAEPPQSILHLFAPSLARSDTPALPTLTLREHHVVTADSAYAPPVLPPHQTEAEPRPDQAKPQDVSPRTP